MVAAVRIRVLIRGYILLNKGHRLRPLMIRNHLEELVTGLG